IPPSVVHHAPWNRPPLRALSPGGIAAEERHRCDGRTRRTYDTRRPTRNGSFGTAGMPADPRRLSRRGPASKRATHAKHEVQHARQRKRARTTLPLVVYVCAHSGTGGRGCEWHSAVGSVSSSLLAAGGRRQWPIKVVTPGAIVHHDRCRDRALVG